MQVSKHWVQSDHSFICKVSMHKTMGTKVILEDYNSNC